MRFLNELGYGSQSNIVMQDNKSSILLETKGNNSAGKCMRHMDVRYYFVKDLVSKKMVNIKHCDTKDMVGDF